MPTVTIGANTGDTYSGVADARIDEGAPTTNYGSNAQFEVDKYSAGIWNNSLLKFSGLSNISATVTVSSAKIWVYFESGGAPATTISARRLLRNWVEAQATWNVYSTGNSWGTAGGTNATDRNATILGDVTITPGVNVPGYYSITGSGLATCVQDWINGVNSNFGFHLERTDGSNDTAFIFLTSSDGTDTHRPYLEVTYTSSGGSIAVISRFQSMMRQNH